MTPDLSRGHIGQLAADHDRRQEAPVLAQPALDAPVVHCTGKLGGEVRVEVTCDVTVVAERQDDAPDV